MLRLLSFDGLYTIVYDVFVTKTLTMSMARIRQLGRGDNVYFTDGTHAVVASVQGRGAPFHPVYLRLAFDDGKEALFNQNDLRGRLTR